MSFSDGGFASRFGRAATFVVVAGLALAGCTVQPLYAPPPSGAIGASPTPGISVDEIDNRLAQLVRNKLIFALTGGAGDSTPPLYRLHLDVTESDMPMGATGTDLAPTYSVNLVATYQLIRIATGELVMVGTSRGQATYDRTNQAFANVRAKRDAEDRASAVVANDMRLRIATAATQGFPAIAPPPPPPPSGPKRSY